MRILLLTAHAFLLLCLVPAYLFCQAPIPEDNTHLVLMCGPVVSSIPCGTTPDFAVPIAADTSKLFVSITFIDITRPGICTEEYSVTRIWTAMDQSGNTDVCSSTIFVEDIIAPVITSSVLLSLIECDMSRTDLIDL